ncbi:sphingosine-1-phosphate lyase [Hetaerina americana]|uniref:sphingosine-1-phosphate lyase n=1 Tax=Hetaerina americana TaxID=62018 RepID=UPI003A7F57DD
MESVRLYVHCVRLLINDCFDTYDAAETVAATTVIVLSLLWLTNFIFQEESLYSRAKKLIFRIARKIPAVSLKIECEKKKATNDFQTNMMRLHEGRPYVTSLPKKGWKRERILEEVKSNLKLGHYKWDKGFVSGCVYNFDDELVQVLTDVYGLASYTNPLHPDIFPGVCKMEAEVVRMTLNLFHGSEEACGTMTSGGTESILMACKAYRDYAVEERGITHPEMVIPVTAHPAFDKAAAYFGLRIKHVPVHPETTTVDLKAMKRYINSNTCMLAGSAPNFPYGTIDPIEDIAALGRKYNIPVHVDSCLGGFITAFMDKAGFSHPPYDFSIAGVTSISADTHKYGFAPKGSSVVMYSEKKFLHHQYCVFPDWPGGVYGSPTVNGSRAGGIIAACWATLMHFGVEGYASATKKILTTAKYIEEGLREMEEIFVFGKPGASVIAIGSNVFHIYLLSEGLTKRGWNLNPLQFPCGIHLCITYMHTADGVADQFLSDVREEIKIIMKNPKADVAGKMAIYGMAQSIPDRSVVGDFTRFFLDAMYITKGRDDQFLKNGFT